MAFYYVTTCFNCTIISRTEYSFLSKQSVISVSKRARFLSLNQTPELVWDSESYEAGAPNDSSSEDEGGFEYKPGLSHMQQEWPTSRGQASSSSLSSDASDEEEIFQSGPDQQVQTPSPSQWTQPSGPQRSTEQTFRGGPRGAKTQWSATYDDGSSPISVFILYLAEIITLLAMETNRYYHSHLDRLEDGPSPLHDMTENEMLVFLVIIQMRRCI